MKENNLKNSKADKTEWEITKKNRNGNGNRNRNKNKAAYLLGLFFLIAAGMTKISQRNYQRNLLEVKVVQPIKKALLYTKEYQAECKETEHGMVIQWEMEEFAKQAQEGEILIYPLSLKNHATEMGKLVPFYEKGTPYQGLSIRMVQQLESGSYQMETSIEEFPSDVTEAEFLMVEITFYGEEQSAVIPCSAIVSPSASTESSKLYIVEEIPKIWGTALQLKAKPILILESNGLDAAIGNLISSVIVADVKQSGVYEGAQVKLFDEGLDSEEEENEQKK